MPAIFHIRGSEAGRSGSVQLTVMWKMVIIRTGNLHPSLHLGCHVIMMLQVFSIELLLQYHTEVEIIGHRV